MRSKSASNDTALSGHSEARSLVAPVYARKQRSHRKQDESQQVLGFAAPAPLRGAKRSDPPASIAPRSGAGEPLYLSSGNCCSDSAVIAPEVQPNRTYYVLRPCLCRKWFCKDCAPIMGRSLRRRLRDRLKAFKRVFGITLTLDGSLFPSPECAWRYVMEKRLLSLFVKKLHAAGFLHTRDYFWVVEWQEDTQQAHWHLLVDASFIPYGAIVEAWSSFRPKWAPRLPKKVTAENYKDLDRPAFGSVRFTLRNCTDVWTASGYATKYLVKIPEYGFPDWILDYVGRVPRYGHSRGFFPDDKPARRKSSEREPSFDPERLEREPKTLRERVAQCKQQTTVLRVVVTKDGGERIESKPEFRQTLKVPFHRACRELGVSPENYREIRVKFDAILKLWNVESRNSEGSRPTDVIKEDDW